jgi:AraC-like DNA-binding protein
MIERSGFRPDAKAISCRLMSNKRQAFSVADERYLMVRSMVVRWSPGVRTSTPTQGWHRLVAAAAGIIVVRTPQGVWSTPAASAVWVPAGIRADLEGCGEVSLQMLYVRETRAAWAAGGTPPVCCPVAVSGLLREVIGRIAAQSALDRRLAWHVAMASLVLHEVREGIRSARELVWPADARVARIAALVQENPSDTRLLRELCRGQGLSARTVQRMFPAQTGLTFEAWRSRLRFLHATRLLAEGRGVGWVAGACGYRSASAFVVAFRRVAGVTPGEYCRTSAGLKA